jgi:hypothetical protein
MESSAENQGLVNVIYLLCVIAAVGLVVAYIVDKA